MRTRHINERPKALPLTVVADGVERTIEVAIEDHPSLPVVFPILPSPGILRHAEASRTFDSTSLFVAIPKVADHEVRVDRLKTRLGAKALEIRFDSEVPLLPFVRLLAKIAHSYAVAKLGLNGFTPLLTDIILGKSFHAPHLIGGGNWPMGPVDATHQLRAGLEIVESLDLQTGMQKREKYVVVAIRLFQDLDTPIYTAVVGTPTDETEQFLLRTAVPAPT